MNFLSLIQNFYHKDGDDKFSFYLINKGKNPKLIISASHKRFDDCFLNVLPSYTFKKKFFKFIFRILYPLKVINLLPNVKKINIKGSLVNLNKYGISSNNGKVILDFLLVNHDSQKLIILVNTGNKKKFIIKKPLNKNYFSDIKYEFTTINFINNRTNINVPENILITKDNELTQKFVYSKQSNITLTEMHYDLLKEMAKINYKINITDVLLSISEKKIYFKYFKFFKKEVETLFNYFVNLKVENFIFKSVFVHGDFAPWNIRTTKENNLLLLDWEFSKEEGLPFYDLFYYQFMVMITLNSNVVLDISKYIDQSYDMENHKSCNFKTIKNLAKLNVLVDINTKILKID